MNIKKKALLFVAALGLAGLFSSRLAAVQFGGGSMDTDATRHRITLRVYNTDNVVHEDGSVLVWKDGTHDGVDVSSTATANNGLVAGVALGDIPASDWGTLLIHGYHDSILLDVDVSAGDYLVTSTSTEEASALTVVQSTGAAANQALIRGTFAVTLEAATGSTAGTTVKGFVLR